MQDENVSLEALIADANECLRRTQHSTTDRMPVPEQRQSTAKKRSPANRALLALTATLILLLETVVLLAGALYGVMFVLAKGPSPTARDLFIRSVRETSAVGFLANLFYTEAEIQEIIGSNITPEYDDSDSSLIQIPQPKPDDGAQNTPVTDAWGLTDEDGDGIIIEEVRGEGYQGYMMVVLDPSRVIMGSVPESYGSRGYTVEQMANQFDAVAGINGGGFYDPDGKGNGSIPDTMVVYEGQIYYAENGTRFGFAGFDKNHILHVGNFSQQQILEREIQYGVCFGPVLVVNGEAVDPDILASGVNPRTAIGQRADGAVLMLVINGRQISSLGATFGDMAEIFLSYGAVNACNLDGGSSSMMWYDGQYVNTSASVIGIRPIPTSFLVLKEGNNP
ncbi:MAG: phosphodiester glycosidase family protein [Oscillospiraceae bacterium]|nr:phosphodiester glycosidase family protein [Oscillospiraceae bacterium]